MRAGLAAVVLAAGFGTRLRPLTDLLPKALCPVANVPLLDHALSKVTRLVGEVAVNAHAHHEQVSAHLEGGGVHLSVELPVPLGTAGALGLLREWVDGRSVLVVNADTWRSDPLDSFVEGWDGERVRLLVEETNAPSDFGTCRYVGAALMPWSAVRLLEAAPSGLYEVSWAAAERAGNLDLSLSTGDVVDCGTPLDYLRANLLANGGASVVGDGAEVQGTLVESVVWPGGFVGPGEVLTRSVRVGRDLTVPAVHRPKPAP